MGSPILQCQDRANRRWDDTQMTLNPKKTTPGRTCLSLGYSGWCLLKWQSQPPRGANNPFYTEMVLKWWDSTRCAHFKSLISTGQEKGATDTTSTDPDPNLDLDPDPNDYTPAPEGTSGPGITSGTSGTSDTTGNIVYLLEEWVSNLEYGQQEILKSQEELKEFLMNTFSGNKLTQVGDSQPLPPQNVPSPTNGNGNVQRHNQLPVDAPPHIPLSAKGKAPEVAWPIATPSRKNPLNDRGESINSLLNGFANSLVNFLNEDRGILPKKLIDLTHEGSTSDKPLETIELPESETPAPWGFFIEYTPDEATNTYNGHINRDTNYFYTNENDDKLTNIQLFHKEEVCWSLDNYARFAQGTPQVPPRHRGRTEPAPPPSADGNPPQMGVHQLQMPRTPDTVPLRVSRSTTHTGACRTYFPQSRTRCIDPGNILVDQSRRTG